MVDSVKESSNGKVTKLLTLEYGPDNDRFKTEFTDSVRKYTRYYFDTYEKEIQTDGSIRNLNYIYAGGHMVAIYEQKASGNAMHYVYTDYLSSLRCMTDDAGNVEQRLSFDAWGNRRNALTGDKLTDAELAVVTSITSRGFTGHEHLDELGLINMNGRIYEPSLGLFLSPDEDIQEPDFTQNYNRYAYCLNNPLMYFDPTGNNFMDWLADNWKPIVVAAVAITTTVITAGLVAPAWEDALFTASFSAAVGGFVSGVTQAALNGGDWGDMISAGVTQGQIGGVMVFLTAGLGGLIGQAPLATNAAGQPISLMDALGNGMANNTASTVASMAAGSVGSGTSAAITPRIVKSPIDFVRGDLPGGCAWSSIQSIGQSYGDNFDQYDLQQQYNNYAVKHPLNNTQFNHGDNNSIRVGHIPGFLNSLGYRADLINSPTEIFNSLGAGNRVMVVINNYVCPQFLKPRLQAFE
jgi:RHS repeat-associated protein